MNCAPDNWAENMATYGALGTGLTRSGTYVERDELVFDMSPVYKGSPWHKDDHVLGCGCVRQQKQVKDKSNPLLWLKA